MTNLDSMLKSRDITLPTKVHLVEMQEKYDQPRQHIKKQRYYFADKGLSVIFPVIMYGCEIWSIEKADH